MDSEKTDEQPLQEEGPVSLVTLDWLLESIHMGIRAAAEPCLMVGCPCVDLPCVAKERKLHEKLDRAMGIARRRVVLGVAPFSWKDRLPPAKSDEQP